MSRMIATWKMSYEGVKEGALLLKQDRNAADVVEKAIQCVENEEKFCSVGYGGLPNKDGIVELDSAFMDGKTLSYGAIMGVCDIKNPIVVARSLAKRNVNCVLCGKGAERYALENGFETRDMLTETAYKRWQEKANQIDDLKAYEGHDTVCMIAKDNHGDLAVGVSTSGLFMKDEGRVGDSPIIGSGFYCDNEIGAAAATGLGEDIMRGCLSIRLLDLVKQGIAIQEACDMVLDEHIKRMDRSGRVCDAVSIIAMDRYGNYGASTNIKEFPYVVIEGEDIQIYVASYQNKMHHNFKADVSWIASYQGD